MAEPNRLFPMRRHTGFDPFIIPARPFGQGEAVAIPGAALKAAGITTFEFTNMCPGYGWLRGWTGAKEAKPQIFEMGHPIPPGGQITKTTQFPDWVSFELTEEPGFPLFDASGNFLYPTARGVLLYGGGF